MDWNNTGIVICSDAGYLAGALATINSCRLSNPIIPIAFLDAGLSGMQRKQLSGKVDRVISLSNELSQFDSLDHRRMNAASFGSLYADKAGFSNFVFIDSDALLLAPVEGFIREADLSTTFLGVAAGGVRRSNSRASQIRELKFLSENVAGSKEPLNPKFPPVNAGFWATSSDVMREIRLCALDAWATLARKRLTANLNFPDQSLINFALFHLQVPVALRPLTWNLAGVRPQRSFVSPELAIRFNRTTLETKFEGHRVNVIHYSGNLKPWTPKDLNSAALLWILHSDAIEIEKSFARIWLLLLQGHYWRLAECVQIVKRLCQEHHTSELYLGAVLERTHLGRPPILRGVLKELRKGAGDGRKRKSLYQIVLPAAPPIRELFRRDL